MTEHIAEALAAFTANGGADGFITVADNTGFYPGALAWIWSSTQASRRVQITSLQGTTKIGVRFHGNAAEGETRGVAPSYGRDSVSAFLLADGATIDQEAQAVRVIQPTISKIPAA